MESNDSPEIPDRGETSDIPGLPLGGIRRKQHILELCCFWLFESKTVTVLEGFIMNCMMTLGARIASW